MTLGDCHCHLSVEITKEGGKEVLGKIREYEEEYKFSLMSTNHIDVDIVKEIGDGAGARTEARTEAAVEVGTGAPRPTPLVPYFGVHPWYSHLFATEARPKAEHYQAVLTPDVGPELLDVLPEPILLQDHLDKIRRFCNEFLVCGIGEIGLDKLFRIPSNGYYGNQEIRNDSDTKLSRYRVKMDHQVNVLVPQLELARELDVAVSLHCVKAHGALYDAVVVLAPNLLRIVLHSFTGSIEQALLWKRNFNQVMFSFSNYINGSEAKRSQLKELVELLEDNQILIESDLSIDHTIPDINKEHLEEVTTTIAELKGMDKEDIVTVLHNNLWKLYTKT